MPSSTFASPTDAIVSDSRQFELARRMRQSPAGITLNRLTRKADWQDQSAVLSQREFMLLDYLMRSPGYIFSRKQILQHVWNFNFDPQTNVVDVCVQRIRKKLISDKNSKSIFPIESIRGVGYRINLEGVA